MISRKLHRFYEVWVVLENPYKPTGGSWIFFNFSSMEKYSQNLEYEEASASSKPINLELIFSNRVASPVYTGRRITGEVGGDGGNESIKIKLVDGNTRQQVTYGRAASLKVKIVLIRGDFRGVAGDEGIWTPLDFENNIVINFEKKKNLLLGDLSLILKDGSGTVGEVRIKHDSNPLRNVKFRLGAMVDDDFP
ncbi:hypothetical protein L1987_07230 [Smallanthus sonchifolius]|uniref:Uncharacterized protein n=1 Tax=Smallanthus sonchifolius TaxID=185202 RepID=A0ACB9K0B0_9ASTR|nr:hypothetical protein L1987_07230 [Smallanthus sonchifolius]